MGALALLTPAGLPPARARLVDINRRISDAERHLATLQRGKAELAAELSRAVEAERELQDIVDDSATRLVDRLRSGGQWLLSAFGSARARELSAALVESRIQAQVGEKALSSVGEEIAELERQVADLKQSKAQAVRAVLVEVASGYRADLNAIAEEMRQLMVILSSLDKFTAVPDGEYRPDRRITVTIPAFGGLREQAVIAPTTATAKARNIWSAFAEKLHENPLTTTESLVFPTFTGSEDEGKIVYHELSPTERHQVDQAFAQGKTQGVK
jgi:hypothetical protein